MTLYPQLDDAYSAYYSDDDRTVSEMINYYYTQSITVQQAFWTEADQDVRFKIGDQTLYQDNYYGNMPAFRKRFFNFNRIRRIINMVTGYQRQHRHTFSVTPVEDNGNETASQLTKALIWATNHDNVLETISDAFEGALTTGLNLLSVWMDYRKDPINGNIKVDNLSYNEYLIDPFFKRQDLSDCRHIYTRKWFNKTELKSLFPTRAKEIDSIYARGWRDGRFQFQPEAYNYAMQDLLTYDEFWYKDYRNQKLLVDTESGATLEWTGTDYDLQEYRSVFPTIDVIEQVVPTVKLAIQINGRTFYHGPNPAGIDRYPYVPMVCYYEPDSPYFPNRLQGMVRGLRDAQYLYNRRKVIELDILESQINSGIKFKEDALVNPADAFLTGQGRSLALKKSANMEDVQQMLPPQIPPTMIQLSEILGRELQEIAGINEELLGMADDDKSGVLAMLRQGAGLTTLQKVFDQLNLTQKLTGEIMLELIQKNFTPGKMKKILGEEPSQEFYSQAFAEYDVVVEEGLYSMTQKQMQFRQLIDLRQMGLPIPASTLISASTLQNKDQLLEEIGQEEQAQAQMSEEAHEAETQVRLATIKNLEAQSMANQGLGLERVARIEENRALAEERMAQAENQKSLAVYHELHAAKELQNLDMNQLYKLLEIVEKIKTLQHPQETVAQQDQSV